MSTMWRKAMLYLGLGPEEEYDDYYEPGYEPGYEDDVAAVPPSAGGTRARAASAPSSVASQPPDESSAIGAVRPIRGEATVTRVDPEPESQRVDGGQGGPGGDPAVPRPRPQAVRSVAAEPNAKPHVVVPTTFNQAQEVADKFRGNQAVIVNLQAADRDLARRLIDFASGLCYGLGGQMEKVANQVYLLTPTDVEVSAEERRRLHERGYDG